uniref:Uncharacterized protein n=1 Tax=Acrobeloides nanus TaxID=290746 RepID=A0A914CHF1_9BILA
MFVLHYLVFLSLVVFGLCKNLTCKFGDGTSEQECLDVDYCVKYRVNSIVKYGRGCGADEVCQRNNISNNECSCDLTFLPTDNAQNVGMICCCDSDNCDTRPGLESPDYIQSALPLCYRDLQLIPINCKYLTVYFPLLTL